MKRFLSGIVWGILAILAAGTAFGDTCTDPAPAGLAGTVVGSECQVNGVVAAQGTYTLTQKLHLCGPGGSCTVPVPAAQLNIPPSGNTLTLNVAALTMDVGSRINGNAPTASGVGANITVNSDGDVVLHGNGSDGGKITSNQSGGSCTGGGKSGNITINSAKGNFVQEDGSIISAGDLNFSPKCPGGEIIVAAGQGSVSISGKILSQSSGTGNSPHQAPGGGHISIFGGCEVTEFDSGVVSSRGLDPGADLVEIAGGLSVLIDGLVESTSNSGHSVPDSPPNHCATGKYAGFKPANTTGCIQLLSGGPLTIDSIGSHNGELNADQGFGGGHQIAWIDVFAAKKIQVFGGAGTGQFAIHANEFVTNAVGGLITVKGKEEIDAKGFAVQANATTSGGHGGDIDFEGKNDDKSDAGAFFAANGATTGGGGQGAGTILLRAWSGTVSGDNTSALRALGAGGGLGSIKLRACIAVNWLGSSTPAFQGFTGAAECGSPTFPPYIVFPASTCGCVCP